MDVGARRVHEMHNTARKMAYMILWGVFYRIACLWRALLMKRKSILRSAALPPS